MDLAVVGARAAGLATAIFAARLCPGAKVSALDGARGLGPLLIGRGRAFTRRRAGAGLQSR